MLPDRPAVRTPRLIPGIRGWDIAPHLREVRMWSAGDTAPALPDVTVITPSTIRLPDLVAAILAGAGITAADHPWEIRIPTCAAGSRRVGAAALLAVPRDWPHLASADMFTDRQFAPPASVIVSADFPWPATPADLYRLADVSDIADELILLHDFTARRLFWIKTMYLRGHQLTASVRHQVTTGRAAYPPASGIPDDDLDQTA